MVRLSFQQQPAWEDSDGCWGEYSRRRGVENSACQIESALGY